MQLDRSLQPLVCERLEITGINVAVPSPTPFLPQQPPRRVVLPPATKLSFQSLWSLVSIVIFINVTIIKTSQRLSNLWQLMELCLLNILMQIQYKQTLQYYLCMFG